MAAKSWQNVPKLETEADIKNWHHLGEGLQEKIKDLLTGKKKPVASNLKVFITKMSEGDFEVAGQTFDIKDDLKKMGAKCIFPSFDLTWKVEPSTQKLGNTRKKRGQAERILWS